MPATSGVELAFSALGWFFKAHVLFEVGDNPDLFAKLIESSEGAFERLIVANPHSRQFNCSSLPSITGQYLKSLFLIKIFNYRSRQAKYLEAPCIALELYRIRAESQQSSLDRSRLVSDLAGDQFGGFRRGAHQVDMEMEDDLAGFGSIVYLQDVIVLDFEFLGDFLYGSS